MSPCPSLLDLHRRADRRTVHHHTGRKEVLLRGKGLASADLRFHLSLSKPGPELPFRQAANALLRESGERPVQLKGQKA